MNRPKEVVAITVTYGDRGELCLATVEHAIAAGASSVIVVMNGVESRSRRIIEDFCDNHSGVSLHDNGRNVGSAGGFAEGLIKALDTDSQFVWMLDDDNFSNKDALTLMLSAFDALCRQGEILPSISAYRSGNVMHRKVAAGASPETVYPGPGSAMYLDIRKRVMRRLTVRGGVSSDLIQIPYGPYGGLLLHRDTVRMIGMPARELVLYEDDTEYTARLAGHGGSLYMLAPARVDDGDAKWVAGGRGRGPMALVTAGNHVRLHHAIRNRIRFDVSRCHSTPEKFSFVLNSFVFLAYTFFCCLIARHPQEIRIVFRAFWRGVRNDLRQDRHALATNQRLHLSGGDS